MKPITWAIVIFLLILPIFPGMSQAQGGGGQEYVIQHSDSLWRLAEKYLMDGNFYPLIIKATASKASTDPTFTPINDPNLLYPGQKIWIPDASVTSGTHLTAAGEAPAPAPVTSVTLSLSPSSQPGGHIAFAFWNNAPNRCTYEINIIDVNACLSSSEACQATRRIFALNNASEPALSPDGNNMAFRGWGVIPDELENRSHPYRDCAEPEANRWIQTSTLDATSVLDITGFFEDSHPDWSPDGSRILFDSGRNGDGITRIFFV
jgi:hypothetical protein